MPRRLASSPMARTRVQSGSASVRRTAVSNAGVLRSAVALLPSFLLVLRAGGISVLRTNRIGAQFGRAVIWGGSNVASFFAYHLLPLADAVALTFAGPLFLTALSWPD